ncbi:uncharacterized protein LOC103314479 isoform X1 [Tribolium castaneum]|uniref:uncharacterized protein LOC103314479 isoform X1 n=1 Tax=Tribolium castaneum TaxID=7070 RepID=UPI0030FED425
MNESSSLNDSKVKDSEKSLCELASHEFATIKETITFVDKTLFIKCLLSDTSEIVLLTAPRAFGKTTLMDMLKQFLLGKRSLFENLKICTEETQFFSKHCRSHPVIHIDLGSVRGSSFTEVKHELALAINRAFREHEYLVKKTDDGRIVWTSEKLSISHIDVKYFENFYDQKKCIMLCKAHLVNSLTFLSKVLHTHYEEKVFILIDEYDAVVGLVFESCPNKDDIGLINDCLKHFMASTLKFNDFIKRSLIFACVRLAGAFSGDAARVIKHYPFLSDLRYAPYLGFTDEEVKHLLELPEVKAACGKVTFKTITEWYDGYMVSNSPLKIFSSWSVLNLLKRVYTTGTLKYSSFWIINPGHVKNLGKLFAEPSVREKIEELISNGEVKIRRVTSVNVDHLTSLKELICLQFDEISEENVELFLHFLADSGYFNILSIDKKTDDIETNTEDEDEDEDEEWADFENDSTFCVLKIPNFEIKQHVRNLCYSEALAVIRKFHLNAISVKNYVSALNILLQSTSERAFVDLANAVLVLLSESQKIMNEKELHHILYTLVYDSRYFETHSEVQIKKKRKGPGIANTLDVVIISKYVGIIFEYKMNSKSANEALQQIFEKQYYTKFDEPDYKHISKKIYAGLTFEPEEKKVFITYQVGTEGISKSVCSDTLL